jgi:hypothetical protein
MCLGFLFAFVAQWIEHPPPKGRVARSIRAEGTIFSSLFCRQQYDTWDLLID